MTDDTRSPTMGDAPHPNYGPCDGFGPGGECSQCTGVIERDDGSWIDTHTKHVVRPAPNAAPSDAVARALEGLRDAATGTQRAIDLGSYYRASEIGVGAIRAAIAVLEQQAGVARPEPASDAASAAVVDAFDAMGSVIDALNALEFAREEMAHDPSPDRQATLDSARNAVLVGITGVVQAVRSESAAEIARLASELAAARADAERWREAADALLDDDSALGPIARAHNVVDMAASLGARAGYTAVVRDAARVGGWLRSVDTILSARLDAAARAAAPGEGDALAEGGR